MLFNSFIPIFEIAIDSQIELSLSFSLRIERSQYLFSATKHSNTSFILSRYLPSKILFILSSPIIPCSPVRFNHFIIADDVGIFLIFKVCFNALSIFESQILSYKQDTEFENLCFVNKARALLWFTYVFYWYKSQSNVAFFCLSYYLWTHWISLPCLPRFNWSKKW